jgi:uncharacterized membrane protein
MLIIRLLHILIAIWMVGGLIGRSLAFAQARRAGNIQVASALLRLSDRFERLMAIPGSQAVLISGLLTAWLQGQPLLGFLQGSRANWLLVSLALVLALVLVVAFLLIPRRRRRLAAIEVAVARDELTPELRAALDDRIVLGSRAAELAIVAAILVLMILKPF